MNENELSEVIIGASIKVHRVLGPGLLESVYENALVYELNKVNLKVLNLVSIPIKYGTIILESRLILDILVDDKVIVELKSVKNIDDIHKKQLLTHLRLAHKRLGLLINFNNLLLKDGIYRIINGYIELNNP